ISVLTTDASTVADDVTRPLSSGATLARIADCPPPCPEGIRMSQRWLGALWSGDDRRQRQRVALYFNCRWLGPWGEERARISSLSPTGCYIESRFSVPPEGEPIQELAIVLP